MFLYHTPMVDTFTNKKWLIRICIFPNASHWKYENSCGIANMPPYVRVRKEQTGKISPGTFFANQLWKTLRFGEYNLVKLIQILYKYIEIKIM